MKFKLFLLILTGLAALSYAIQWYNGMQVPAWQALIWVCIVFINDFYEYMEGKM